MVGLSCLMLIEKYNHSVFVECKIKIKQYPVPLQNEHVLDMLDKLLFLQVKRRQ
jgi:hypothetical protein